MIWFKQSMTTLLLLLSLFVYAGNEGNAGNATKSDTLVVNTTAISGTIVETVMPNDSMSRMFIKDSLLFTERWDTLAQPQFWRTVMKLPPDSGVLNVAATRVLLEKWSVKEWDKKTDKQKEAYRDTLRIRHALDSNARIFFTTGKSDFYQFDKVMPSIDKGIQVFIEQGVDPWYAQAILLIESPGKLEKSNAGAYGPFQLMKSVARNHGLTVNKYKDERKDFVKSAQGASSLIKKICLFEARAMLKKRNITFSENELWFRLLVLHIYHAGAGNVGGAMDLIDPKEGSMQLITTLWQTEYKGFKNASQNYSQVALASLLELDELIYHRCHYMYGCEELE